MTPLTPTARIKAALPVRMANRIADMGLSWMALSQRLGVHPDTIDGWRAGISLPSLEKMLTLAEVLDTSMDWLCGRNLSKGG